ncbi:class I SAM-dependent methyltransferase [Paractinoplanes globisporus]|uniref:Class I SAM-dependent methyltransferase n=1 Tax=Paractinoplanes globisporus TaxID=113565 RepID=A0ABW6WVJ4_9ACTN|nr:methyltransferase domain-containing protein [Actinoplanes globisporus]
MTGRDARHWADYNDAQAGRAVRELCGEVIALAGPGEGRTAIDLGCGAGVETRALLHAGWRVHAIDSAPGTPERVLATVTDHAEDLAATLGGGRLTIEVADLATLDRLPPAGLVYSGYSLQYLAPDDFARLWPLIRESLRPGAWLAVTLLGDRDEWAGTPGETFLAEPAVRGLVDGLDLHRLTEEDADGPAFGGTKHWHVFHVIARAPG